jgi:hypothetical protein
MCAGGMGVVRLGCAGVWGGTRGVLSLQLLYTGGGKFEVMVCTVQQSCVEVSGD